MKTKNNADYQSKPTVFVIDDDKEIRDAVCWLLESIHLNVLCFENAKIFLASYNTSHRGCIVADVRMPGISGLELLEELGRRNNRIPIIMITGHGDIQMAVRAMKSGAMDFVLKPFNDQQLLEQIQKAIDLSIMQTKSKPAEDFVKRMTLLTRREREVLELVVFGKLSKQIAYELNIAISTVELHRSNIMHKLEVRTLADLIRFYLSATLEN